MHISNGTRSWTWELRPPRLLLAGEDRGERQKLAGLLRADGYEVVEASSAAEVLDEVLAAPGAPVEGVDVVIADESLPCCAGMDELVTHLRQMEISTPCVLLHHPGRPRTDGRAPPDCVIDAADVQLLRGAIFELTHSF